MTPSRNVRGRLTGRARPLEMTGKPALMRLPAKGHDMPFEPIDAELGDHVLSGNLPPEMGYMLLDATDGQSEELAHYLDRLPNAVVQEVMCCNIFDVSGAIVRREGPGQPAQEIWATTHRRPSADSAEFCLIFNAAPMPSPAPVPTDDEPMQQQVNVTVKLTFSADATLTRDELASEIADDINRLLDADSGSRVEMVNMIDLQPGDVREEREIYASDGPPPDPDGMNASRAEWASRTLDVYMQWTGCDRETAVGDLLNNLIHRAVLYFGGYEEFEREVTRARRSYYAETVPGGGL